MPIPILRTLQIRGRQSVAKSKGDDNDGDEAVEDTTSWPSHGPPLQPLIQYTSAFFGRHVHLLFCAGMTFGGDKVTVFSFA